MIAFEVKDPAGFRPRRVTEPFTLLGGPGFGRRALSTRAGVIQADHLVIFDDATTPPTLLWACISLRWLSDLTDGLPPFYQDAFGIHETRTGKLVMQLDSV